MLEVLDGISCRPELILDYVGWFRHVCQRLFVRPANKVPKHSNKGGQMIKQMWQNDPTKGSQINQQRCSKDSNKCGKKLRTKVAK